MLIGDIVIDGMDMLVILVASGFIINLLVTVLVGRWICKLMIKLCGG